VALGRVDFSSSDEGRVRDAPLTPEWGAPVRLRIPTKLGFKSAKNLQAIEVTNIYPGGFWEDQGYNWFSGS
jgi:DMSO/TMAO reductase YedYZ molybdopterin-dependent catalytic subunit